MADVNHWPGYDLKCHSCGAGVRPIDLFCSQCGRRDPAHQEGKRSHDQALTSATVVSNTPDGLAEVLPDVVDEHHPTFVVPGSPSGVFPGDSPLEAMSRAPQSKRERHEESMRLNTQAVETMLAPGSVFARRYRIQRFLGSGAMGYVCSAIDESIDEMVALKVLSLPIQEDPDAFERFKTELKLARRIRHRNVVQSFDLGFAEGYPFISMEYIDADNLQKHLTRRTTYDEQSALAIMRQVLRGLQAAHDLGIVHRDIKPENILLHKDRMAFITDFGVATSAEMVRRELAGTPDYMAPEQLRCEMVGPSSDLYSCGVVLYRMLTGVLPYKTTSIKEVIEAHLKLSPEPIDKSLDISAGTRDLVLAMLEKRVLYRPRTARELLDRIDVVEAKPASLTRSGAKQVPALVIEHNPERLTLLGGVLRTAGYRVLATDNAREAVNLAFEKSPAIIFLDAEIRGGFDLPLEAPGEEPAADALGFVRIIKRDDKLRPVPVVVMSDPTVAHLDNTFKKAGVANVMRSPLSATDLLATLSQIKMA